MGIVLDFVTENKGQTTQQIYAKLTCKVAPELAIRFLNIDVRGRKTDYSVEHKLAMGSRRAISACLYSLRVQKRVYREGERFNRTWFKKGSK